MYFNTAHLYQVYRHEPLCEGYLHYFHLSNGSFNLFSVLYLDDRICAFWYRASYIENTVLVRDNKEQDQLITGMNMRLPLRQNLAEPVRPTLTQQPHDSQILDTPHGSFTRMDGEDANGKDYNADLEFKWPSDFKCKRQQPSQLLKFTNELLAKPG